MAIFASDTGSKEFKKVPPGCHFAICNLVVDLGVHRSEFQGQVKSQHKIYLRWEVPDERITYEKDGKKTEGPCSIGATYTLSLHEKAKLRHVLENWRGRPFTADELKGFDISSVAGKCCQLMVTHTENEGKIYASVSSVIGLSKEQRAKASVAKSEVGVLLYSLDDPDADTFEQLPKWIKEKLRERVSAQSVKTENSIVPAGDADFDDDIPF